MIMPPVPTPPSLAESPLRQALLLAAWAGFWAALEQALAASGAAVRQAVFLGLLTVLAAVLAAAARDWARRLLVSVKFAVTQGVVLAAAALPALAGAPPFHTLAFAALLAVLAASALAIAWQRRPYPWSRVGFLITHLAPAVILAGLLAGGGTGRLLLRLGLAALLAGSAWMFYLKPVLKRREAKEPRP